MKLFSDGSVQSDTGLGYGAYLIAVDETLPLAYLRSSIKIVQFENTSSTRLEVQIFLWALGDWFEHYSDECKAVECYTDCQTLIGLPARREKLEKNNYIAKSGKRLNNADLYQQLFALLDQLYDKQVSCRLNKLKGHSPSKQKTALEQIFTLVDKAARNAVRQ